MQFNGIEKDYIIVTRLRRPYRAPRQINVIEVLGTSGGHVSSVRDRPLIIPVQIEVQGKNRSDYLNNCEDLAEWLTTDKPEPLVFKDRPNRTYYAMLSGSLEPEEIVNFGYVNIDFICPDPFKYGEEKELNFTDDSIIIDNKGTASAKPIIELTAKEKSTFAMVTLGDEQFNIIGQPADDDVQIVDSRTSVLYENGSTIGDWQVATNQMIDKQHIEISGEMGADAGGIRANDYGTGNGIHGPAVFKEINPVQDFEIEATFDINSTRVSDSWRMGINFLDENLNMLGHIGLKDNSVNYQRRTPLARFGEWRGGGRQNGNLLGDADKIDNSRNLTLFYLRVKRIGNTFDFYIAEWRGAKHERSWHETYRDVNNEYAGKLKYITLYIGNYADRYLPSRLRINSVEVFELATVQQDQTPYIIYPGDVVTFDHVNDDVLLNGELSKDTFFGDFFELEKGQNHLTITPEDTFDTKITYRERFR